MTGDGVEQDEASHPSDGYPLTVPKSEAEYLAPWAEHFEAGDTIQYRLNHTDGVQEAEVLGFSSETPAVPVIRATELDDSADDDMSVRVRKKNWVSDDTGTIAEIELEYRQRITVSIPTDEMPAGESGALDLVKNTDPEFVVDALPSEWDQAASVGGFEVVDLSEEADRDE